MEHQSNASESDDLLARVRRGALELASGRDVPQVLDLVVPGLGEQFERDLSDERLNLRWGSSSTEGIPDAFLRYCQERTPGCFADGCGPAGILHTYGYLLTGHEHAHNEKYLRWTSGTVERILGEEIGGFLFPPSSFLGKVTAALETLAVNGGPSASLAEPSRCSLQWSRLTEHQQIGTVSLAEVFGPGPPEEQAPSSGPGVSVAQPLDHLLVYRVGPSPDRLRFVTVFPLKFDTVVRSYAHQDWSLKGLRFNACLPTWL